MSTSPTLRRRLKLGIDLALFGLALYVLRRVLSEYHYSDVLAAIHELGGWPIAGCLGLSALGYAALIGYDYLSLRLVGKPLPLRQMWLPSFVSFAVANSAPVAILTGGGLRYRLYSGLGLTPGETARLTAVNVMTYAMGLFTVAGFAFLFTPLQVPADLHFPVRSLQAVGATFLVLVAGAFAGSSWRRHPIRIWRWRIELPPPRSLVAQLAVACADWLLSSTALYALLAAAGATNYPRFLSGFLLAQIVTLVVPLPGGIGVFEAIMLVLPPAGVAVPVVAAALLLYRVCYYLIPLVAAGTALIWRGTARRPEGVAPSPVEEIARTLVPHLLAVLTFLSGLWLLLFGALPSDPGRLAWLGRLLPLAVIEGSHFLGSMVGTGLLLLSWGLARRIQGAWRLTLGLLALGIPAALLRSGDVGIAGILLLLALALVAARHAFERRTPMASESFDAGWAIATLLALVTVAVLAQFAHQHLEYADRLWWEFAIDQDAPRALRMVVGIGLVGAVFVLGRLVAFARHHPTRAGPGPQPPA
jgi:phosphatidylglycerol lysyltransferase